MTLRSVLLFETEGVEAGQRREIKRTGVCFSAGPVARLAFVLFSKVLIWRCQWSIKGVFVPRCADVFRRFSVPPGGARLNASWRTGHYTIIHPLVLSHRGASLCRGLQSWKHDPDAVDTSTSCRGVYCCRRWTCCHSRSTPPGVMSADFSSCLSLSEWQETRK